VDEVAAQQKAGPVKAWWVSLVSLASIAVIFVAAQVVGGLLVYQLGLWSGVGAKQLDDWVQQSISVQFLYLLVSEGLIVLGVYGMLRLLRWSWQTIGLVKPQLKHIGLGALAVAPYYVLYLLIAVVVSALIPSLDVNQKQEIGFDSASTAGQLALTFVSLVVIPPLVEEIAMRGFVYSGLRTWMPKIVAALVVSAVFGLAHLSGGGDAGPLWIGAIDTFTLSFVLVYLREKTGNLWAGIILHALKNFVAFMLVFVLHVS